MSIKKFALDKALAFLAAAGADYVVVFDGQTYQSQTPVVAEPLPEFAPQWKPRKRLHHFDQDTDYRQRIDALQVGEVAQFRRAAYDVLKTEVAWINFGATVSSKTRTKFGVGNYLYRVDRKTETIEVLRTA